MACSTRGEAGYATATFGVLALGLAIIATALLAFTNDQLRSGRIAARHATQDRLLDGALVLAADAVMRDGRSGPFAWSQSVEGQSVRLLAEPEAGKASADHPEAVGKTAQERLGLTPSTAFHAASGQGMGMKLAEGRRRLLSRSASPLWRACSQSLFSPLSASQSVTLSLPVVPEGGALNWRAGEVWRIATFVEGRSADAIVRFTGDASAPIAVLDIRRGAAPAPDTNACVALAMPEAAS